MSKVFYDKPIIDQIFEEFCKSKSKQDQDKLIKLVSILPPEDVNKQDVSGFTVLILASIYCYTEIIKILLGKEGININFKNKFGNTALNFLRVSGHTEIIELLENHKSDSFIYQ